MEATRGKHQFYFVGVGSAPTHIDQMPNPEDPNFSQLLDQVFGGQNFRSEMSPYNRVGRLNAKYFFMEHSRTDTLVPFNHALQFYEAANASQKKYPFNLVAGNPASKDPTNGLIIGSHNFSSGSVLNSMLLQALKEGQPALINFSKSAPQPKKRCRFAWLCSS